MKYGALRFTLLIGLVLVFSGCKGKEEESPQAQPSTRRGTAYGQAMQRARDVQGPSAHDQETSRQARELKRSDWP
jgi:hypothetical protein